MRYIYRVVMVSLLIAGFWGLPSALKAQDNAGETLAEVEVTMPKVILRDLEQTITLTDAALADSVAVNRSVTLNGLEQVTTFRFGKAEIKYQFPEKEEVKVIYQGATSTHPVHPIPLWLSILPPLIAILMAFVLKEVYSSLFVGSLIGATIIAYYGGASALAAPFVGILDIVDTYIIETVSDSGNASVIVFLLLIGSTVALVSLNGGMRGLVRWLSKYAKSPRSGQFATFCMDICIFFDDYANTLVVGSTMRPVARSLNISKEKLSFIVDSTAAPVAALALITTWIGAELSYIEKGLLMVGIEESPYAVFIASIPYRFYPILMLCMVLFIIGMGRDYGPMLKAERLARGVSDGAEGDVPTGAGVEADSEIEPDSSIEGKWYNAVIPVGVLIVVTVIGIFVTGYDASIWSDSSKSFGSKLMASVGGADSYVALLWASICSTITAIIVTASQRILSFEKTMEGMMTGFKIMIPATIVLVLAWTLALMTQYLHTADFVSSALIKWNLPLFVMPVMTFILAGIIAFSTGTSWGTMAILYPLLLPVTWQLAMNGGLDYARGMDAMLNVVSCILAGAVMGDHCSPISDTTIMSSSSTGCNHIEHVRTQIPYALTVGGISVVCILLYSLGVTNWIVLPVGIAGVGCAVRFFGKKVDSAA